jgi:ABC-2 type transport system ATP-binding protein
MVVSIQVENVSKEFSMQYTRTLKQMAVAKTRGQKTNETFLALEDITFTAEQGDSIGLMGLNGSGKSTLLKLINGIMHPTTGTIRTRGRISGLIATGAGFHNQMTGRENVYMNAAILGMSARETDAKFDEIAGFADIGKFLDTPVGNYSSGMFSRLGFAIAVHVDCDIFIADEVLAVGDRPFKKKCMAKMEEVRDSGRTIFYVSHSTESVRRMCKRVILLEKGRMIFDGPTEEGIEVFEGDDYQPPSSKTAREEESIGNDV